jgi:multidrug resistance efflux pump
MDVPRRRKPRRGRLYAAAGGGVALLAGTAALWRMPPAAPSVERATVVMGTVKRGPMVLEVRGRGTLVPERIRWVTSLTQGRVERILVRPGTAVKADTVLVELSNPDLELKALEAQRQVALAESDLVTLRSTLEQQKLAQEAAVATLRTDRNDATRKAEGDTRLHERHLVPMDEVKRSTERAAELDVRMALEGKRLDIASGTMGARVGAERTQIGKLRAIVAFQQKLIEAMKVRAGSDGVLSELPLEEGQWVTPGTLIAKVVRPERLKAVVRIAETPAKDVQLGQRAEIDTHAGLIAGRVARIDPAAQGGTVAVDIALEGELPRGARPDLTIDGTIELERLPSVLYVGRPAYGQAEGQIGLFKILAGTNEAARVRVKLGRASVSTVEVQSGLGEGDQVILSDTSAWDSAPRVRLK